MSLEMPESMDECLYFSRRSLGENGQAVSWVKRPQCSSCKKGVMQKPRDEKTGKPKIRATEYECSECGTTVPKKELEESCQMEIQFTCPGCNHEGEATTEYKLKSFMGAKAYVFSCDSCGMKLGITKKMKETKK